jgi:hypothetical protein
MYKIKTHLFFSLFLFSNLALSQKFQAVGDTTTLRSPQNQADYLIISVDSFQTSILPLEVHRQSQGHNVLFIDVNQIYQEFGDSLVLAKRIRHFISYALEYWQSPKPKYVLLYGDSDIIPPFKLASYLSFFGEDSVAIDEWFAVNQFESDELIDLAIGRIPASSAGEAYMFSQKVIHFEDSLTASDYNYDLLILADSADGGSLYFEVTAGSFISNISPYNIRILRIDIRYSSPHNGTLNDFIAGINDGTLFLNYFGLGNEKIWSIDTFFTYRDINLLANENLPFVMTTVTGRQNFDFVDDSTIVERLLFHSSGGAIATIASTGECYLNLAVDINYHLYQYILAHPDSTLGTAVFRLKQGYPTIPPRDNDYRRVTLLGDPALKLPSDFITGLNQKYSPITKTFYLHQNYPNPFNPTTAIDFDLSQAADVTLKILNILGEEVLTLVSTRLPAGTYTCKFEASNLSSGLYFYRLETGNFTETKKMILIR